MKIIIFYILIGIFIFSGCTPQPELKVTAGAPQVYSEQIIQATESTPLPFDISAPVAAPVAPANTSAMTAPASDGIIKPAPTLNANPSNGSINCSKITTANSEKLNCVYTPKKYFFGEDRVRFLTKNLKGKDAYLSFIIKVANTYSRPVAFDASFSANPGDSKLSFTLPEAYEPDYPQDKDSGLVYGAFVGVSADNLKCVRRNCTYDTKQTINATTVISFTYRAIESIHGENNSDPATIKLTFQKSTPPPSPTVITAPSIADISITSASFLKEVNIPFRALVSNEAIVIKTNPTLGSLVISGTSYKYQLSKFNFVVVDDSFTYQIKRTDSGKETFSDVKKVTIHIGAPTNPALKANLKLSFDPKVDVTPLFTGGFYTSYPIFQFLSKYDYEKNLPVVFKFDAPASNQGSISCDNSFNCTYTLKTTPSIDGKDTFAIWIESGDPTSSIVSTSKVNFSISYYAPTALAVDDVLKDPMKYVAAYPSINLQYSIRGVQVGDWKNVSIEFIDAAPHLMCNADLLCTVTPPNPLNLINGELFKKLITNFKIHYKIGTLDLVSAQHKITLNIYPPKAPKGNVPTNIINASIAAGTKITNGIQLIGSDEDSTSDLVTYSALTAVGDSASKVEIKNIRRSGYNQIIDINIKDGYVVKANDSASFTYYLQDETNLKSDPQTLSIMLSPPPPTIATAFVCTATIGARVCTKDLPVPSNKADLGNYTYRLKTGPDAALAIVAISGTQATITLAAGVTETKSQSVSFQYEVVSEVNVVSPAQNGSAFFQFKTAANNVAPVIGANNNFPLTINATSETRTIDVTDVDSYDKDLRVFFDGAKTKNSTSVTSANGNVLNILCGGANGDVNPTQCKFTLSNVNSDPLKVTSDTFSVNFQVRDIFMDAGVDVGKSSSVGTMKITFSRDMLPMNAVNTNCAILINQKSINNCDISNLAIYETLTSNVNITVTNAATNGNDKISCAPVSANGSFKITCSLTLASDINSYPLTKDFTATFGLSNTSNSALSMSGTRNIKISFSREPQIHNKTQSFSTSSTAQIPGVDILWVVDNTFTMKVHQEDLSSNFSSLINSFVPVKNGVRTTPYPFKMGAITTDGYMQTDATNGDLCAFMNCTTNKNTYSVNSDLAKSDFTLFSSNFDKMIKVGTTGNSVERSLESMQTFVNKNTNWINKDNLLVLIFISDELEQSYKTDAACPLPDSTDQLHLKTTDPAFYSDVCAAKKLKWSVDQISALKTRKELIKVFSIVDFTEDHGKTYQGLSTAFDGSSSQINSPFATLLSQIGTSITDKFLEFVITDYQGTIKTIKSVKVDGVDQAYTFTAPNKIKLNSPPPEGKTLTVDYDYTNND